MLGISCNYCTGCIGNRNNITLQVLIEIICRAIVFDSANGAVKVVQVLVDIFRAAAGIRYKLLEDIRSVKDIVVNFIRRLLPSTFLLYHTFSVLSRKTPHPETGAENTIQKIVLRNIRIHTKFFSKSNLLEWMNHRLKY